LPPSSHNGKGHHCLYNLRFLVTLLVVEKNTPSDDRERGNVALVISAALAFVAVDVVANHHPALALDHHESAPVTPTHALTLDQQPHQAVPEQHKEAAVEPVQVAPQPVEHHSGSAPVLAAAQHDPAPALTQPAPVKITSPVLDHAPETIPMSAFYNFAPAHFESPVSVQSPVSLPAVEAFLTDI
jgi:hypothetical protein